MKRFLYVRPLLLLAFMLTCQFTGLFAQLAVFNPTSPALSNYGPTSWSPTSPPPTGISVTGWTRAAGVGTSGTAAGSAWGGNDWQQTNNPSDALASNKYVYFSIQATAGYTMSLTTWNECYRRSGTGPANGLLQYSVNAGPYTDITTFTFINTTSGGACLTPVDLSTISALQNVAAGVTVTFRILLYGATGSTGTWYIYQASGMSLNGTVTAVPSCTTPASLAASGITTTTANLSWGSVAGAVNYEYIVDQSPSTPATSGTVTTNTFYNATGLTPATTYYLHVRTNCGATYSAWVTIPFTTLTPCTDPTGLAANNITTTSADLNWNTVATALNYEYIIDQSPATPATSGTVTTNLFYNATGLTPATTYYLHVRANCGTPNYSAWVTIPFTTLTPCTDPTGLAANNITTTSADLNWNTVATALNYEYIVDQSPATPATSGTVTTNLFYNATGLTPATTYYLHVRANCGTPNYSAWVTIPFITLTPCTDPTGLAANNITTTSADLNWNTVATALNYEYIVDQSPATPATSGTVTTNLFYNATGLTPATTYYLHVRANCGTPNYSAWVTIPFITLTPCPDPTGLAANNLTTTSADLSWNTIATALNYEYIVDQSPTTPAVPGTVSASPLYNATGLTPATTYYLHVRANCGTPNYSAWVTVSFATIPQCADPTGLTASVITNTSALLSWDSLVGPSYEYVVDQSPAAPVAPGTAQANTTFNATALAPATNYYLHVRTDCGGGNFSNWITMPFTTMGTASGILVGWDVNGLSDYGPSPYTATVVPPAANVTAGGLTRGASIAVPALPAQATDNAWGGMNFYGVGGPYVPNALQDCIDNNAFLYFKIKSQPGYTLSLSSFDMFFGRYGLASPSRVTVQYGIDSTNFLDLATAVHPDTPVNTRYAFPTIDLTGVAALQQVTSGHTVYFRIVPVQSGNDTATAAWFVYNGNTDPLLYQGSDIFLRGNWDVALPLQLLSFTGFAGTGVDAGNILTWTTANEQGIKNFSLERSYDAKAFDVIATLSPKGNTATQAVYQYIDKTAAAAHSFYRLKISDLSGSYKYSEVVEITRHSNGTIAIYPNPVHDKLYVNTGNANVDVIRITDMIGKIWDVKAAGQPGALILDVSSLPNAMYTLQLSGPGMDKPQTISFVKQ